MINCVNCGAPIDALLDKCQYCGTYNVDMTAIDVLGRHPVALVFKQDGLTMRALCRPASVALKQESFDIYANSSVVGHYTTQNTITVEFDVLNDECTRNYTNA